ncbi:MAG: bile acid:sodium symporter family protein [Paenibacillaceae bacterium]|nr:bile acid:sodium symporter family protein [Paenibacillaceae bacterium]
MFLVVPVALLLGFAWSGPFGSLTGWVPWLFGYLTFVMALGCSPRQVADALRMPGTILLTLAIVHIVAPPAAYGLGALLFGHDSPFVIGFVLFAVIPLGVSSVIWVGVAGGNVPLALSLIVLDSALSPFVVPAEIAFFFGKGISFDHWKMMSDLLLIVVVPTIVGVAVNALTGGRVKTSWGPVALPLSKISFFLVVLINAAAIAPQIGAIKSDVPVLLPAVLVLVAFCYAIGYAGSAGLRNDSLTATLLYASGMRNISLGVVIGLAYFEPRAAVPVVLAILVQQPMATLMYTLVKWSQKRFGSRAQSAG